MTETEILVETRTANVDNIDWDQRIITVIAVLYEQEN
jgi:hypothetical protein